MARAVVAVALAAVAAIGTAAPADAGPRAADSPAATQARNCVVVVGRASSPDRVSPELFRYCSTTMSRARAQLNSPDVRRRYRLHTDSSRDLLMTWFQDTDYGGGHTDIYGDSGTCDTAGYRIAPDDYWQRNMSSAAGFAQCNWADFTNRAKNFAEGFKLPVRYLGEALNDNVGIVHVYHG